MARTNLEARFPVGQRVVLRESTRTKVGMTIGAVLFAAAGIGMLISGSSLLAAVGALAIGLITLAIRRFGQGGLWLRLDEDSMTFTRPLLWSTLEVRWDSVSSFTTYGGAPTFCAFVLRDGSLAGTRSRWSRFLPGVNLLPTKYAGATSSDLAIYLEEWRAQATSRSRPATAMRR